MQLSKKAADAIKDSNKLMGLLMGAFNKGQKTIENWIEGKDIRLTTPLAVELIAQETGFAQDEILIDEVAATKVSEVRN